MPYIGNSPANTGNYQIVDDISSSFNGSLTSFALTSGSIAITPAKSGQILANINGVMQEPDDGGTNGFKVTSSNIIFSSAPASGDTFWAVYQGQNVDIGTPSDDVVDTAHIKDDAVTAAKLANSINTEITANTAKTGITTAQASAITANTTTANAALPKAGGTMTGDLRLNDGVELELGTSAEFKIKHHASGYTHLENTVGTLYVDSDSVTFRDDDGSPNNMVVSQTGIDVTGTVSADVLNATNGNTTLNRSHSSTTATIAVLDLKATSTGDMADGFGTSIRYQIQDTAGVENTVAEINVVRAGSDTVANLELQTADITRLKVGASGIDVTGTVTADTSLKVGTFGVVGKTANDVNIYSTEAGHNGLRMHVNGILPTDNAGTIVDADADLGDPSYRFKDLYLSGGAYIGGNGAANKLDDYEEGTWTPVTVSFAAATVYSATYTKIGNVVYIQCYMELNNATGTGSAAYITGLPFTNRTYGYATGVIDFATGNATVTNPHIRMENNVDRMNIYKNNSTAMTGSEIDAAHFIFSFTYRTDS